MGEVYRAHAPELGRDVAIKMLKRDDPEWVDRLRREAAAMRRLDHPNVCKIIEVGVDDGRHYVAMDYVDGQTLDLACRQLPLEQRVRLLVEICSAIAAAHAEGLVHRDIKPANILVQTLPDGTVKPWVMDFGLVKDLQASTMTVAGQILGTPNYMAPEQARGEVDIDRRVDVYALGAILYFLLTDCHPFEADSASAVIARLHAERIASPKRIKPQLPAALEAICLKAMERDRGERYASATALGEDLQAYLAGRSVRARPINLWYHWRRRWQDHRLLIAAAAVLLAIALLASATAIRNRLQLARSATLAAEFGAVVERNAQRLRLAQMSAGSDLAAYREQAAVAYAQVEQRAREVDGIGQGAVQSALGRLQLLAGDPQRALSQLRRAWELGERSSATALALGLAHVDGLRDALAEAALQRDATLRVQLAAQANERWRQPALQYLQQAEQAGINHPAYGRALIAYLEDDHVAAREQAEAALSAAPWLFEAALLSARSWMAQAREADLNGDVSAARAALAQANQALNQASNIATSAAEVLAERCATAVTEVKFVAMVEYSDPSTALDAAREICDRAIHADSESAAPMGSMGRAHAMRARYYFLHGGGDPLVDFERAEALMKQALSIDPDNVTVLQQTVSMLRMRSFFESDRSVDPEPWVRRGLAHVEHLLEVTPNVYTHYNSWGNLLLDLVIYQRDYGKDTRALINEAVQRFKQALVARAEQPAVVMNLAVAYSLLAEEEMVFDDRPGATEAAFEAALGSFDRAAELDPDDWDIPKNRAMLSSQYGRYLLSQGTDPRPMLAKSIAALKAGLQEHPDDLTALLALAGSLKYVARAAYRRGEADHDSIVGGLAVVDAGMALDSGRYVDLAQHGLAIGRLQMLLADGREQAQSDYGRLLAMARRGHTKQSDPDPDLLRESAHLVLLASELGLSVSAESMADAEQWLALYRTLSEDERSGLQLGAWLQAIQGKPPPPGEVDELSLPAQWRIALVRGELASANDLQRELRRLPADLWWDEPVIRRLSGAGAD